MSDFSDAVTDLNTARIDSFSESFMVVNVGAISFAFQGVRGTRQRQDENVSPGAFESIWTRRGELPVLPSVGSTLLLGDVEYIVHDVRPDPDPSDGITIYLNRKRPLT